MFNAQPTGTIISRRFANGGGGEENDHTDDGMLFFGCKTTPSHPLFSCFTIGMTRDSFPIPWPWSPSAFHSFPNECCTLKLFELWTGGRSTSHFRWYLFYFMGKTGHELHHIWYHRKNKAYSWTVVLPMWTIQKFRHDCPTCNVN